MTSKDVTILFLQHLGRHPTLEEASKTVEEATAYIMSSVEYLTLRDEYKGVSSYDASSNGFQVTSMPSPSWYTRIPLEGIGMTDACGAVPVTGVAINPHHVHVARTPVAQHLGKTVQSQEYALSEGVFTSVDACGVSHRVWRMGDIIHHDVAWAFDGNGELEVCCYLHATPAVAHARHEINGNTVVCEGVLPATGEAVCCAVEYLHDASMTNMGLFKDRVRFLGHGSSLRLRSVTYTGDSCRHNALEALMGHSLAVAGDEKTAVLVGMPVVTPRDGNPSWHASLLAWGGRHLHRVLQLPATPGSPEVLAAALAVDPVLSIRCMAGWEDTGDPWYAYHAWNAFRTTNDKRVLRDWGWKRLQRAANLCLRNSGGDPAAQAVCRLVWDAAVQAARCMELAPMDLVRWSRAHARTVPRQTPVGRISPFPDAVLDGDSIDHVLLHTSYFQEQELGLAPSRLTSAVHRWVSTHPLPWTLRERLVLACAIAEHAQELMHANGTVCHSKQATLMSWLDDVLQPVQDRIATPWLDLKQDGAPRVLHSCHSEPAYTPPDVTSHALFTYMHTYGFASHRIRGRINKARAIEEPFGSGRLPAVTSRCGIQPPSWESHAWDGITITNTLYGTCSDGSGGTPGFEPSLRYPLFDEASQHVRVVGHARGGVYDVWATVDGSGVDLATLTSTGTRLARAFHGDAPTMVSGCFHAVSQDPLANVVTVAVVDVCSNTHVLHTYPIRQALYLFDVSGGRHPRYIGSDDTVRVSFGTALVAAGGAGEFQTRLNGAAGTVDGENTVWDCVFTTDATLPDGYVVWDIRMGDEHAIGHDHGAVDEGLWIRKLTAIPSVEAAFDGSGAIIITLASHPVLLTRVALTTTALTKQDVRTHVFDASGHAEVDREQVLTTTPVYQHTSELYRIDVEAADEIQNTASEYVGGTVTGPVPCLRAGADPIVSQFAMPRAAFEDVSNLSIEMWFRCTEIRPGVTARLDPEAEVLRLSGVADSLRRNTLHLLVYKNDACTRFHVFRDVAGGTSSLEIPYSDPGAGVSHVNCSNGIARVYLV